METVRVFLVVLCLAAGFGSRLSSSGIVAGTGTYEKRTRAAGAGAVLRAAQKEIGVREDSANAGKAVDRYAAYLGFRKIPWCAAFVCWCFGQAGYGQPKTAWSPALFPAGRLRKDPLPGMVIGIYFPALGRIAHCGILERLQGDFVVSIEGNTNEAGSREGQGVYRRMRHRRSIAKLADWL